MNNISKSIEEKIGRNLYLQDNHPVKIVKDMVFEYFEGYEKFCVENPAVDVVDNFDFLRIPKDHPGRAITDTYYKDEQTVLRTHMTSYIKSLANKAENNKYVICGDVYRKDTVDATHFPVFHQIDGFAIIEEGKDPIEELKALLGGLIEHLFPGKEYHFQEDSFPFTEPSLEVEVKFGDQWLEILGGGSVHYEIMDQLQMNGKKALAFGLGIERLAMIIFDIKDIRLFWSEDERFLGQFESGKLNKFVPYSKYPEMKRDISMWVPDEYHEHDFYDLVRNVGGELVEHVELFDQFKNPKRETNSESYAFHLVYRSNDRTLTDEEVNEIHKEIERLAIENLGVEIR